MLTQAVPPHEAVFTLKEMVLNASPMHSNNLMSPLSEVDLVRNSSYKIMDCKWIRKLKREIHFTDINVCLTKLSPISHRVTEELETFGLEIFRDDLGAALSDSPNIELFKLYR